MSFDSPKVTVLMPVYNSEQYLRASIDSILNQTFQDFEFLTISESGTSEESIAIIESYSDERIRHIRNKNHLGLVESLNLGLKEAKGKYIARLDADDLSMPERLSRQVQFLDEHPEIGVVGTGFEIIDYEGKPILKVQSPAGHGLARWQLFFYCNIVHPSVMIRRVVYEKLGGYSTDAHCVEDYEFWLRAAEETQIAILPDVLLRLRKHNQNVSHINWQIQHQNSLIFAQQALSVALGQQVSLDRVLALRDSSSITSAKEALDTAILLYHLYLVYTNQNSISEPERKHIRIDTSKRLLNLTIVCAIMNPFFSVMILTKSIRLYPSIVIMVWLWTVVSTIKLAVRNLRILTGRY